MLQVNINCYSLRDISTICISQFHTRSLEQMHLAVLTLRVDIHIQPKVIQFQESSMIQGRGNTHNPNPK